MTFNLFTMFFSKVAFNEQMAQITYFIIMKYPSIN